MKTEFLIRLRHTRLVLYNLFLRFNSGSLTLSVNTENCDFIGSECSFVISFRFGEKNLETYDILKSFASLRDNSTVL